MDSMVHGVAKKLDITERLSLHVDIGGFPSGSDGKEFAYNAGDLIPGSGRSSGEENSNPLQYSCLGNPQRSLVCYSPWGCKGSGMTERLIFWVL